MFDVVPYRAGRRKPAGGQREGRFTGDLWWLCIPSGPQQPGLRFLSGDCRLLGIGKYENFVYVSFFFLILLKEGSGASILPVQTRAGHRTNCSMWTHTTIDTLPLIGTYRPLSSVDRTRCDLPTEDISTEEIARKCAVLRFVASYKYSRTGIYQRFRARLRNSY